MTIDRLLVLLLSLSFLLLAPPAATRDLGHQAAPVPMSPQSAPAQVPDPAALPDEGGLFLLTTAPEASVPAGTDDSGGHDDLALPDTASAICRLHADLDACPAKSAVDGHICLRPWATGPPQA